MLFSNWAIKQLTPSLPLSLHALQRMVSFTHSVVNFHLVLILSSIRRHHPTVADDSREDVRALARKRAEWELTGVRVFACTVYCSFLFCAVPARLVNKEYFSPSISDSAASKLRIRHVIRRST